METNQALAIESRTDEARLGFAARIGETLRSGYEHAHDNLKTYIAIGATAFTGVQAAELVLDSVPVVADNLPAPETVSANPNSAQIPFVAIEKQPFTAQTSSLQQRCINHGLIMPKLDHNHVIHPGIKPFQLKDPYIYQLVKVGGMYPAMPDECVDYERIGKLKIQIESEKKIHGKARWLNMTPGSPWAWIDRSNEKSYEGAFAESDGHLGDWYFWKPGKEIRDMFNSIVKNKQTGEVVASRTKIERVEIGVH